MKCPECGGNLKSYSTENTSDGEMVIRRRECQECGAKVKTGEVIIEKAAENMSIRKKGMAEVFAKYGYKVSC